LTQATKSWSGDEVHAPSSMNAMPRWSVRNRVAVNLFTLVILVLGFYVAGFKLTRALFPDIQTNFIRITTLDPTTSVPVDIERTITVPIEEELSDVQGVTRMTSYSQDNFSSIFLEIDPAITELDPVLNEVRQAVDQAVAELPDSSEVPIVEKFDIPAPLITLVVTFPPYFDIRGQRSALDRLERRLKIVPGVSEVLVDGLSDREIWVELDPYKLQGLGVSLQDVSDAVSRKNVSAVGGRLNAEGGERVIRIPGEVKSAEELETLPVKVQGDQLVLLRDVATIKETSEEEQTRGRFNMAPSITYTIVKKKGADAIDVANRVRAVFAEESARFPKDFETAITGDTTKYINTRIETVLKNGCQALILVSLLLMLFLNWRLGAIVSFGLPVSFAGTFAVLFFGGYTINLLSLFAMIMALGMVVDDAIVISENSFRYLEEGISPAAAAIRGTGEVIWPVLGSVSTTVAAFLPLILAEGLIGKFLVIVPVVVISTLTFSLAQAFLVLPSHFTDFVRRGRTVAEMERLLAVEKRFHKRVLLRVNIIYREMRIFVNNMLRTTTDIYLHLLTISLRLRYWVIGGFILSLVCVGAALALGVVRFQLFAVDFADRIILKLDLPADYSLDQAEPIIAQVEKEIAQTLPGSDLVGITTRIGARLDPTNQFLVYGSNVAMITVDIDEQNPDCRKPSAIERDLNDLLRKYPEFTKALAAAEQGGPPVGRPINVEIQGEKFEKMREIASLLEAKLTKVRGVYNVNDDLERGKTEFQIVVDQERAARQGLDVQTIGRSLQAAFLGLESSKIRWGNDEVTIRVKMQERYTRDPELLRGFRLMNRQGRMVSLDSVAEIIRTSGLARIKRQNQERMVTVSGDVDDRVITSAEINNQLEKWIPEIEKEFPGYYLTLTGENEDTEKSVNSMKFAAMIALFLIYTLLATISNSFVQPFVIMAVIPFGVVGVVIGLIIMQEPLGLMSIMGTIALAGIVVNNSVVFVDFINQYRFDLAHENADTHDAPVRRTGIIRWRSIMESGRVRFRPIFLTTATTVAGLVGLAFTTTGQEQFLAPMAQAIVFGLTFATLLTMVLIPCLYSILDDVALWREHRRRAVS
jgi:multidrug efflux pump subunit AcrB